MGCWEMAFENIMATIIGSNAVPLVIKVLGAEDIEYEEKQDLDAARTLGLASTIVIVVPWTICFCVYTCMLWSFPIDYERVKAEKKMLGRETLSSRLRHISQQELSASAFRMRPGTVGCPHRV